MSTITWIILAFVILVFIIGMFTSGKGVERSCIKENLKLERKRMEDIDNLKVVSYKAVIPLRIQACERLLLYVERIQFSVLVKRIFQPGLSRDDFQFSLMQNVQDEFEHNLAQRLYVSESTWRLVCLAKEEVLRVINSIFTDNPDADNAAIAAIIGSLQSQSVENAALNIKREFDSYLI